MSSKIDLVSLQLVPTFFCGYDESSQGYVCYDTQTSKFKVRATVSFDEMWRLRDVVKGVPIHSNDNPVLSIDDDAPYPIPIGLPVSEFASDS